LNRTGDYISVTIDKVNFQLQEEHDFSWLHDIGEVFCVFDQQDSGNIAFGLEKNNRKVFLKYAGAKPINFSGNPEDAVRRLVQAIPVYERVEHPHLIKLLDHFSVENGYAVMFEWFDGECLHSHWAFGGQAKYTHPDSPFYRFRQLDVAKRLDALDIIFAFHCHVEAKGMVAVDFYDGSILYDFEKNETKICDIDFYRNSPSINDIGKNFWGSTRLKSPEEYELGAPIDSITNVYTMGSIAFWLIGRGMDHSFEKWEANEELHKVALRAVEEEREKRYKTIHEFYEAWKQARRRRYVL
jgi:serine/threonine protein kinase